MSAAAGRALARAWETVIGLEVHAQIESASKLFSAAPARLDGAITIPNSQVAWFDAGIPGTLPVLNEACVAHAVRVGFALRSTVHPVSVFERKHYFYCDLPLGYQITQLAHPIVSHGVLGFDVPTRAADGRATKTSVRREARISRVQLEVDSGKSVHDLHPAYSLVDLNRAGVGLLEIVTEPDFRSPDEVSAFLKRLTLLLRVLGTNDSTLEDGSIRCDLNVSVRRAGSTELGKRVEMKNMNSLRGIVRAIEYEAKRQVALVEEGGPEAVPSETRLFNAATGATAVMRTKESSLDYRFMPEPDLPPLVLSEEYLARLRAGMPELPDAIEERMVSVYGISGDDCATLVSEPGAIGYFEALARGRDARAAAGFIVNVLFAQLNRAGLTMLTCPVTAGRLGVVLDLVGAGTISLRAAKGVVRTLFDDGDRDPVEIVRESGLAQVSDEDELRELCERVVASPGGARAVERFPRRGALAVRPLIGIALKESRGAAHPQRVNELITEMVTAAAAAAAVRGAGGAGKA